LAENPCLYILTRSIHVSVSFQALLVIKTMAHNNGTSLFCLIVFYLTNCNPAFAEVLGVSCNTTEDSASITDSMRNSNSTCVCESDFVADSTNKMCLPVAKELGSDCEEKVQCSTLDPLFDCVEKKCTSKETGKKEEDSQEESGNKGKCTDQTCSTEGEKKFPCADGNCTTPTTPSAKVTESIAKHTPTEGIKTAEKKSSGGSSVVKISFLGVIWVVHLVM